MWRGKLARRKALRYLVEDEKIVRDGTGKRGDPFKYRLLFPCSPHISGTREQETEKWSETRINTGGILVPDSPQDSIPVPGDEEVRL